MPARATRYNAVCMVTDGRTKCVRASTVDVEEEEICRFLYFSPERVQATLIERDGL